MSEINKVIKVLFQLSKARQKEVSKNANIPISTLNKFLNGSTTLNTNQLVGLLMYMNIDLCSVLRKEIEKELNPSKSSTLFDIENVISSQKFPHQKENILKLIQDSIELYKKAD